MVNYEEAVKRPFTDLTKLIIGIALSLIPIVNITIITGYAIENSGLGKNKKKKLPEWGDWTHLFMQGLKATVIGMIYVIPAMVLISTGIGMMVGGLLGSVTIADIANCPAMTGDWSMGCPFIESDVFSNMLSPFALASMPILFIGFLIALLTAYVIPMGVMNSVKKKRFGAAFELGTVFRKAMTKDYLFVWIVVVAVSALFAMVLSNVPYIGMAISSFVMSVIGYNLYGQVYKKAK